MKKLLIILMLSIFIISDPVSAVSSDNYKVQYLIDKGWVEGHGDGNLGLKEDISRSQFTKMVILIENL